MQVADSLRSKKKLKNLAVRSGIPSVKIFFLNAFVKLMLWLWNSKYIIHRHKEMWKNYWGNYRLVSLA